MQLGLGHIAPGAGQQIFVSFQLEKESFVKDLIRVIKGMQRLCAVGKNMLIYDKNHPKLFLFSVRFDLWRLWRVCVKAAASSATTW